MTIAHADVAEKLGAHYDAALQSVRVAARDYDRHREKADAASSGSERGEWQAQATLAEKEWTKALGAAAALEALADALGVGLEADRRRSVGGGL